MSPFSQLGSILPGKGPHHNGLDHEFSPILHYIDEFDRHFSHRHRFMNCFIPRFDLEEDSHSYYLYGELPGAKVEDITIEAHGENTLVVYGRTNRPYSLSQNQDKENKGTPPSDDGNTYVNVKASDAEKPIPGQHSPAASNEKPNPPHHDPNRLVSHDSSTEAVNKLPQRRTLLSERLVGEFHRTFTFPCPIAEEGVKASMENGVLYLLVPKVEGRTRGRRIQIEQNRQHGQSIQNT